MDSLLFGFGGFATIFPSPATPFFLDAELLFFLDFGFLGLDVLTRFNVRPVFFIATVDSPILK